MTHKPIPSQTTSSGQFSQYVCTIAAPENSETNAKGTVAIVAKTGLGPGFFIAAPFYPPYCAKMESLVIR